MAREVYRVEIPIEATDGYSREIKNAEHTVSKFEKSVERTTSRAKKRRDDFNRGRWSMTLNAVDKASRVVSRVSSYIHRVANRSYRFTLHAFDMATRTIGGIRRAITSIPALITIGLSVVGAGKLKDATVGAAMSFEGYETSMTHWLDGNTKQAKELVQWMGKFADTTPFSSVDLFPALTRGIGVTGGDVKQAQSLLKLSADMAALTPGKTVSDAMEALADSQMGEMERLKEFNIKLSKKDFQRVGFAGVIEQLGKKFDGGARKLSETSEGIISTLKGYRSSIFRSMGTGFLDPMKPRLQSINKWLAENQDTWGSWKETVKNHGKQASEFIFSNLEKGFGHIRSRYLDNNEFMDMSFKGKIDFVLGDINEWWSSKGKPAVDGWWESSGKPWASKTGLTIGEAIFEGVKTGLSKGLETIGDMWIDVGTTASKKGVFSKETAKSAGGATVATLGAGALGAAVLSPFLKVIGGALKGGKKSVGGLHGAGRWAWGKTPAGRKPNLPPVVDKPSSGKQPTSKPSQPPKNAPLILDQHGKPLPSSGRKSTSKPVPKAPPKDVVPPKSKGWKVPKFLNPKEWKLPKMPKVPKIPKGASSFMKKVPFLGTLFGAATIAGSSKKDLPGNIGAVGGGIAGAKGGALAGAAVGSIVPGVGTAIGAGVGGLAGGIGGALGGEKLLTWLFGPKKVAAEVPKAVEQPGSINSAGNFAPLNESSQVAASAMSAMAERTQAANRNIETLTSYLGQASGWVVEAFYSLPGSVALIKTNLSVLTQYLGEASLWVVEAFNALPEHGTRIKTNSEILTSYLGQASGWVVGAFSSLPEKGGQVSSALGSLAARINNIPTPNISGGIFKPKSKGTKAYANGGFINRPHVGLVGEAGPEMIIPLSSGRRNRAMELYQRTGAMLGISAYADGGMVGGAEPVVAMPNHNSASYGVGGQSSGSVSISMPVAIQVDGSNDKESIIQQVINEFGSAVIPQLREALSNRT